jgi:hypothetical protein
MGGRNENEANATLACASFLPRGAWLGGAWLGGRHVSPGQVRARSKERARSSVVFGDVAWLACMARHHDVHERERERERE